MGVERMEHCCRVEEATKRLGRVLSWAIDDNGSNLRTHLDEWAAYELGGELLTRGGRQRWFNNPCPVKEGRRLLRFMDRHSLAAEHICLRGEKGDPAVKKPAHGEPAPFRILVDHSIPIKVLGAEIRQNNDLKQMKNLRQFLRDNFRRTVITFEENKRLDKVYKQTMPSGWTFGDDPFARYAAAGIELARQTRA